MVAPRLCGRILMLDCSVAIKNTKNTEFAIKLSRVVIHVLSDAPPSVPQRGEPLVSALRSRKFEPRWERTRLRKICRDGIRRCIGPGPL